MQEEGAAGARPRRIVVVAEHDDDVVEVVLPPHLLVAGREGAGDRPVVVGVGRVVAPPVQFLYRPGGEGGDGLCDPVRAIVDRPDGPTADRAHPVALGLFHLDAAPPDRAAPALVSIAGLPAVAGGGHDQVHEISFHYEFTMGHTRKNMPRRARAAEEYTGRYVASSGKWQATARPERSVSSGSSCLQIACA